MTRLLNHSDFSLLRNCASWVDPQNTEARIAFTKAMRGRAYGYEALLDAWSWFLVGWTEDASPVASEPVDIDKHPGRVPVFLISRIVNTEDIRAIWNWWNGESDLAMMFRFFEFLRLRGLVK